MQIVLPNQENEVSLPIVAKATGNPITSGVVNFYLKRLDTKKWFRNSDSSWQNTEVIAGVGIHDSDGHWYVSLVSAAWILNNRYKLYAKESGNLHIPVGEEVQCKALLHTDLDSYTNKDNWKALTLGTGAITVSYYVYADEEEETGPIGDCKVWVTTDAAGLSIIASGYTNSLGKVTFYLDAGTYYMFRKKSGYNFINPDTEVVS